MLFQALDLMLQFYRNKQRDENGLREELIIFGILMRRAAILSPADIEEVTQKMVNYDPFLMEDPHFGGIIQKAKAEGVAKGLAAWKSSLSRTVAARFPNLAASLENVVWSDTDEALDQLSFSLATTSNEATICRLLGLPVD